MKDIYGGDCTSLGLPGDLIASSFGKAAQTAPDSIQGVCEFHRLVFSPLVFFFRVCVCVCFLLNQVLFLIVIEADLARSLLLTISNDIGQIASLYAMMHGLKKVKKQKQPIKFKKKTHITPSSINPMILSFVIMRTIV